MVSKFLDDNKPKTHLKVNSHFFKLIQFHLICEILAKFSGVESETSVFKFRKRKRKFLCWHVFTYSIKQAYEIR